MIDALDDASVRWILTQWKNLDREDIGHVSDHTVNAMRRVLDPPEHSLP